MKDNKIYEDFFDDIKIEDETKEDMVIEPDDTQYFDYRMQVHYANKNIASSYFNNSSTNIKVVSAFERIIPKLEYLFDNCKCITDYSKFEYIGKTGFYALETNVAINRREPMSFIRLMKALFNFIFEDRYCTLIRFIDKDNNYFDFSRSTYYSHNSYNDITKMTKSLYQLFDQDTHPYQCLYRYKGIIHTRLIDMSGVNSLQFDIDKGIVTKDDISKGDVFLRYCQNCDYVNYNYQSLDDIYNFLKDKPYKLFIIRQTITLIPSETFIYNGKETFLSVSWGWSLSTTDGTNNLNESYIEWINILARLCNYNDDIINEVLNSHKKQLKDCSIDNLKSCIKKDVR